MINEFGDTAFFFFSIFMSELGRLNAPMSEKIKNHSSPREKAGETELDL